MSNKSSATTALTVVVMMITPLLSLTVAGFQTNAARRHLGEPRFRRRLVVQAQTRACSNTNAIDEQVNNEGYEAFHPLGPPTYLSNLPVGESCQHPRIFKDKNITRLSLHPDIFLVRDIITQQDRGILKETALLQGMKNAGTKLSEANTIRKNSYLAWIDSSTGLDDGSIGDSDFRCTVAEETTAKFRLLFSHEGMDKHVGNVEMMDYSFAEDVQVAKYDAGGRFDYHHDGYGRYLTVLTYLNGVGGTFFPFGNMGSELDKIDFTNESDESIVTAIKSRGEKSGILITGKEVDDPHTCYSDYVNPKRFIEIQAGDAVVFYNYDINGKRDLRSMHCGLTVPEEKWIATSWFRNAALTGPFGLMKRARMYEELMAHQ